ncbi:nicotinate-nucleotide adenylyltransferase [Halobacillus fulvus]|nr:nicotinate-nucleotide adenylyltransferase [Halobacillus fulvus]
MKRVGILGGTFDPPHQGHMIMAEFTRQAMDLEEIWFLPSYIPPHKKEAALPSKDRLEMVERAVASNLNFTVCDIELKRKGKSYTVDTIQALKRAYPDHEFFFIIGGDMVEHLPKWHRIDELATLVEFIGVHRPGFEWRPDLPVHFVEIPKVDISSTVIRKRRSRGETIRYLVPEPVYHYIKERQLYGNKS